MESKLYFVKFYYMKIKINFAIYGNYVFKFIYYILIDVIRL